MARYQIQSRNPGSDTWTDLPTDAFTRTDRNLAIAGARVAEAWEPVFGRKIFVRVVRIKRFTGARVEVWRSS